MMITYQNKAFETQKELFKFLIENKKELTTQKRATIKHTDGLGLLYPIKNVEKELHTSAEDKIKVLAIMNTAYIMDSHDDVHIENCWKKTMENTKNVLHLKEHEKNFSSIIASGKDLKVSTQKFQWADLGFDYEGETEALVFESIIRKERNPYMFEQYKNGYVTSHSVGMSYIKVELAINSDEFEQEKKIWDNHIDKIINKQQAIERGFFWAVYEAKLYEGSAVPLASNPITPTISVEPISTLQKQDKSLETLGKDEIVEQIKKYKFFT